MNTNNTAQVTSNIVDSVREQLTEYQNNSDRLLIPKTQGPLSYKPYSCHVV